jgi:shikimate O-hydroxycinnamoyltransferase
VPSSVRRHRVTAASPRAGAERLSVFDLVPRHVPLSYVHFFAARLDADALRAGLARTLASFPALTGRVVADGEGGHRVAWDAAGAVSFVVVERDEPMPRPDVTCGAKAYLGELVDTIPAWRLALAGAPLFRARLTRYRDGSVLGVSLSHALADMHGYCLLMMHWAAQTRGAPAAEPCHERERVDALAQGAPGAAYGAADAAVAEHFVQLSRAGRVRNLARFARGALDSRTVTRRLARAELDALKQEAAVDHPRASTHDALAAHLWRTIGGLRALDTAHPNLLTSIVDLRRLPHAGLPESYFGNATLAVPAALPQRDVRVAPAGQRTRAVRAASERLDRERLSTVVAFLAERRRARAFATLFPRMGIFADDLWINNWSGFPVYELDFGAGRPFWFDLPRVPLPFFALVAPAAPGGASAGVDVHLSLPRALASR